MSLIARPSSSGTSDIRGEVGSPLLQFPVRGSISSRRGGSSISAPGSSPGIGVSACGMATVLSVFRGKPFGQSVFRGPLSVSEVDQTSQLRSWVTLFRDLPDVGVVWGHNSGSHDASNSVSRGSPGGAHRRCAGLVRQSGHRASQV